MHTDASMSASGATLAHGDHDAGARGYYECRGYWQGSHSVIVHITILELTTVRLALWEFVEHCLARERGGEALHG
jgi:hypothetical protein